MTAAPQGIIDLGTLDTTPGAACAFAPPAGARLSPADYRELMRQRYGLRLPAKGKPRPIDHGARQQMAMMARRAVPSEFNPGLRIIGPHAAEALRILEAICPPAAD